MAQACHQSARGNRIPSSLIATYIRYKQDTKTIITWLMSHGSCRFKKLRGVSIRDLLSLGEMVQEKAVVMPDTVDFCFREAIAARASPLPFVPNAFQTFRRQRLSLVRTLRYRGAWR